MEKGNLSKWMKKEGEALAEGDVLAQIETDKAVMDFETPEEGFLAKIVVKEGTKDISIGSVRGRGDSCLYCVDKMYLLAMKLSTEKAQKNVAPPMHCGLFRNSRLLPFERGVSLPGKVFLF